MWLPSGDQAGPETAPRSSVNWVLRLSRQIADPQVHVPAAIACERELLAVGRPRRIDFRGGVVGHLYRRPADRQHQRSPIAVNATARPLGDTTGLTMPASFCGSEGSRGRWAIV